MKEKGKKKRRETKENNQLSKQRVEKKEHK